MTGRSSELTLLTDEIEGFGHKMVVHGGRVVRMVIHESKVKMCYSS